MPFITKLAAIVLAFFSISFASLGQQSDQTTPQTAEILPSLALSALESSKAEQNKLAEKQRSDGILIYHIVVDSDGGLVRTEKISGDASLQVLADPFLAGWHFKKVDIRGSASPWQSLIGVCFFRAADYMVPCFLPQAQPNEKTSASDNLPARLFLVGSAKANSYHFLPLHKKKGARLERPPLVRQIGATGEVVLDVVIAPDGRVSKVTGVSKQSLMLGVTIQIVRGWQFAPVTFLGRSMEVQLHFSVLYGSGD